MKRGYVQLYTGDGKGKSTAAFGLAFRAAGKNLRCKIIQFLKSGEFGEKKAAERFSDIISVEQYGTEEFYRPNVSSFIEHRGYSSKGLKSAREALTSGEFTVVILDEIINALNFNLVTYEEIIELIEMKKESIELVLTGRDAPTDLIERCDLVTEMKEIKHYYSNGVEAREGIEF